MAAANQILATLKPIEDRVIVASPRLCQQYEMTPKIAKELFDIDLLETITLSGIYPRKAPKELTNLPNGEITSKNQEFVKTVAAAVAVFQKAKAAKSSAENELRLFNTAMSASPVGETDEERELRHLEMNGTRVELSQEIKSANEALIKAKEAAQNAFKANSIFYYPIMR